MADTESGQEQEPQEESRAPSPRNQAMNWLARREYSRAELAGRLAERQYAPDEIESAVAGLVADGLVSDERFAESFVAARMRKGQGPVRIRMELQKRGVDSATIHVHIDDTALDWHSLAREVRDRKFGAEIPADFKEKARQMRFLEYRGFTTDQIRAAVGED